MNFKSIVASALLLMAGMGLQAQDDVRLQQIDSINSLLAAKTTSADSISLLYDVFDLTPYNSRDQAGEQLLATALRGGSVDVKLDVMRRLAAVYVGSKANPERIRELVDMAAAMPKNSTQRVSLAFLKIQQVVAEADQLTEADRLSRIFNLVYNSDTNSLTQQSVDPMDRLETLFTVCKLMQHEDAVDRVSPYLDQLGKIIDDLPDNDFALESLYYVQASLAYTLSGQEQKAIDACRKLLAIIDKLEAKSQKEGRKFRNYDTFRYIALRRMLTNAGAMNKAEIDSVYADILMLVDRNHDVASDYNRNNRAKIYYLMANKQYAEALELMAIQIDKPVNRPYLFRLYPLMIEASRQTGNKDLLLKALSGYNEMLAKKVADHDRTRDKEMEIFGKVQDMKASNVNLKNLRRAQSERYHRRINRITTIAGVAMAVLLIVVFVMYRRAHKLARRLSQSNESMLSETEALRKMQAEIIAARDDARQANRAKSDFIANMSHEVRTPLNAIVECSHLIIDNIDDSSRTYLQRYADMIDVSVDMISSLINNVLDISSIENTEIELTLRPESVDAICRIAVDSSSKFLQNGVTMEYVKHPGQVDININTDAQRTIRVLLNLLNNAAKFTEEGSIKLYRYYNNDSEGRPATITFAVEDTGIGVPKGKEEIIFNRFEKLSSLTPGTGLGLNIARMEANLLGGTVQVDTSYAGPGARFLFTLPL